MTGLRAALVVAIASLLLVGVVSQTPIRHVIQSAAGLVAALRVAERPTWTVRLVTLNPFF